MTTVNSSGESDVRKKGYLKKIKTMKRKLFILKEDSQLGPARLEYYDNDKKYKSGNAPKRSIELKSCFNINKNKKGDQKHKYAIDLYTKDDCFSIGCDNEEEQESWLATMLELQSNNIEDGTSPRPVFEHIWQVNVKPRGLGNGKIVAPGVYRLCLTNKTLSLVKHNQSETNIVFQLASIRRCGHTDSFFLLEVGSYTVTGAGELWMQVEDTVIAQNMHETILSSMKNKGQQDQPVFRGRTKTNDLKKPSPKPISRSNTITTHDRPIDTRGKIPRPKTVIYNPGHSPSRGSPLDAILPEQRPRAGSMESGGAASSDYDTSPGSGAGSTSSITCGDSEYFSMTPNRDIPRTDILDDYMPMTPNSRSQNVSISNADEDQSGYVLHKSTGESPMDNIRQSCSTSPALSTCSSTDGGLMDVQILRRSLPTVEEKTSNEPYADMGQNSFRNNISQGGKRLDKVASYYTDEGFPTRCYSVGSKPEKPNKPLDQSYMSMDMSSKGHIDKGNPKASSAPHLTEKEERIQFESGSRMRGSREMEHEDLLLIDYRDSSTSSLASGDSFSSRPRSSSGGRDMRPRLSSAGKDFRKRASSFGKDGIPRTSSFGPSEAHRPRTATIGGDSMRPRTSSFNATDMRPRSSSHGNNYNIFKRKKDASLMGSDLLRKTVMSQHGSGESLKSQSSTDYYDMGRKVTKVRDKHRQVEEQMSDYMGMTPGGDSTEQDYMNFDHTSHKSNKSEKSSVKGAMNISSQKQVTKPKSRGHSSGTLLTVGSPNTRSSSESLSSQASYGSDMSGRRSTGPIDEAADMGEYVDLDYSDNKKSTQKERSKAKKSSRSGKSRESPDAKTLLQQISKETKTSGAKVTQADESYVAYEPGNGNETSSNPNPPMVTLVKVSSPIQMDVDTCEGSGFTYEKTVPQKPTFGNVMNFVPSDPMDLTKSSLVGTSHATSSSRKQCPSPLQAVQSRIQGRSPSPKRSRTSSKSPVFGEKKSDPLAVNVAMASSLTKSKGSISSLSPSDTITGFPTRGSSASLSSMDTLQSGPSSPRGLLTDPKTTRSSNDCSAYENMTFEKKGGKNSSNSSLNDSKQVVYASLDLSAKNEEGIQRPVSPSAQGRSATATAEQEDMPLDYAQIDFKKSEGLKNTSFKENRFPFDVKK